MYAMTFTKQRNLTDFVSLSNFDMKMNEQKKFAQKNTRLCGISLVLGIVNIVILLLLVLFLAVLQPNGQIFQSFLPVIP